MITAEQLRAARHAIRWTIADLSNASGVSVRALKMMEVQTGKLANRASTIAKLTSAFEAQGIEFIGSPDDAPGIRLHPMAR